MSCFNRRLKRVVWVAWSMLLKLAFSCRFRVLLMTQCPLNMLCWPRQVTVCSWSGKGMTLYFCHTGSTVAEPRARPERQWEFRIDKLQISKESAVAGGSTFLITDLFFFVRSQHRPLGVRLSSDVAG